MTIIRICRYKRLVFNIITVLFIQIIAGSISVYSQSTESEMKAVAFQKLSLFIDWPGKAFEKNDKEFIIAVIGKNPFENKLEEIYKNVRIKDRPVRIEYFRDVKQIERCQIGRAHV